jgi:hypothetical protein
MSSSIYIKNYLVFLIANVLATRSDGIDGVKSTGSGAAAPNAVVQIQGIWNMP